MQFIQLVVMDARDLFLPCLAASNTRAHTICLWTELEASMR